MSMTSHYSLEKPSNGSYVGSWDVVLNSNFDKIDTAIYEVGVGFLPKSGGTMTGTLTLAYDPSSSMHAATKQYVDNYIQEITGNAGSTNTGNTYVKRDANGDFSAGIITATLNGNVVGSVSGNATTCSGLRIISGTVNADGTVALGSGFTVTRYATGQYNILMTSGFNVVSSLNATVIDNTNPGGKAKLPSVPTPTQLYIDTVNSAGALANLPFTFIATGS